MARAPLAGALLAGLLAVPATAAAAPPLPPGACVTAGAVGQAYAPGVNCRVVEVDGFRRRFEVYVPHRRPVTGSRAPVVFMFHGSSGTGERFLRISGWRQQAERAGLVAVFPTGLRYRVLDSGRLSTKWNDGKLATEVDLDERPAGYPADAPWPADDLGFTDAMLADLEAELPVDDQRIYASGFSNGANFTARLALERSTVFAAAAYVAGALQIPETPARRIPLYMAAGTLDDRILEKTGPPPLTELPLNPLDLLAIPVVQSTLARTLNALGLDPGNFGTLSKPHSTSVRWPAVRPVLRFTLLDGVTHQYPNGHNNPGGFAAAREFWRFFLANPGP
jgi:polyhydroxybutyrate depolymerase